jgi:hypothetical protein
VSRHAHGDEHDEQVDPDGEVCEETKLLESPDLAKEKSGNGPYDDTDRVAEFEFADLGESFSITDKDDGNVQEQLERLERQDEVSCCASVDTESKVRICSHGVLIRVKTHEAVPE